MFSKAKVHYQLSVEDLVEQTIIRNEGTVCDTGALVISTGEFTGRSPADKFIVKDQVTENTVNWNKFNNPISEKHFSKIKEDITAYLEAKEEIWIRNACVCASDEYRINLRIVTETPSSNLFAANMFIKPVHNKKPVWTVIHAPGFKAVPNEHGTRQSNFTVVSFTDKTILIGGTGYTGEIKKSVFTVLNYLLPIEYGVLSMHCSANEGRHGDTALFFGLSGTGKTTLSSDPNRKLIGDDEHGWDHNGVFNFEGGCYAKVINLSKENEPEIFKAIKCGALVENTSFKKGSKEINYKCSTLTENTRVSYPIDFISNAKRPSTSGVPKNIFFLTCDAYGVLPPISKLDTDQAMYYFLNGYTAKIAGTENGVKEPQATFSACFGAPFLPLNPQLYANLFRDQIIENQCNVWMINTGWTGGGYGKGKRIELAFTRSMINSALNGSLNQVSYKVDKIFNLNIPETCPGIPNYLLDPSKCWTNLENYNSEAKSLLNKFEKTTELD